MNSVGEFVGRAITLPAWQLALGCAAGIAALVGALVMVRLALADMVRMRNQVRHIEETTLDALIEAKHQLECWIAVAQKWRTQRTELLALLEKYQLALSAFDMWAGAWQRRQNGGAPENTLMELSKLMAAAYDVMAQVRNSDAGPYARRLQELEGALERILRVYCRTLREARPEWDKVQLTVESIEHTIRALIPELRTA